MKKIAVITSGLLPLPAVKGGAIETLLQYTIDYNEEKKDFQYEIYSIYDENAKKVAKNYKNSKFKNIKVNKFINTIYFNLYRIMRKLGKKDPNFQKLYINKVCKELSKNEYDIVLIESDNHFVLPIRKITNKPIILYLHNDKLHKDVNKSKEIADECNYILTVSDYIKSRVLTIDSKYNEKTTTILNGIDTEKFKLDNREAIRNKMREKYGIQKDDFVFLFTGRVEPNKGVLELVKAFNKVNNNNAKLIISGGSFHSSNKKTKYVKLIEKEMMNNSNIITTGYIDHDNIPKYHALSDCMVSPSIWEEPAGLINQEAFASGMPVITSKSGGIPEYTKDTLSILIEKNKNFINNLAIEMEKLIENKELQKQMIEAGLNKSKCFSKEEYCNNIADFLKGVK